MLREAGEFPAAAGGGAINRSGREALRGGERAEIPGSPSARPRRSGPGMPGPGEGGLARGRC